jgi:hypothetical protein
MGASASVVLKEEVERLPQYAILGGWLEYNVIKVMHFFMLISFFDPRRCEI